MFLSNLRSPIFDSMISAIGLTLSKTSTVLGLNFERQLVRQLRIILLLVFLTHEIRFN